MTHILEDSTHTMEGQRPKKDLYTHTSNFIYLLPP